MKINMVWLKTFWMQPYSFMAFRTKILMQIDWGHVILLLFITFQFATNYLTFFQKLYKKTRMIRFILLNIHQLRVSERRGTFTLKQLYCLQGNRMLIRYDINSIRFYASMYFSNSIGNFQQINIILKMFLLSY